MSYTLSWTDPAGALHESLLGLEDLLVTLPALRARDGRWRSR